MEDAKGEKDPIDIPRLGKRLKMQLCALFPDYKPSFYIHVFADHSADYLRYFEKISKQVGFTVTLKMLAQDAVEAAHRYSFSFSFQKRTKSHMNHVLESPTGLSTTVFLGNQNRESSSRSRRKSSTCCW